MKKIMHGLVFLPAIFLLFFSLTFCKKKDEKPDAKFVGTWSDQSTTTLIISENGQGSYSRTAFGIIDTDVSGGVKIEGNQISVGLKKLTMSTEPTEVVLSNGLKNTFMVINGDTLFKSPFFKPPVDPCKDGIQNNDEEGIDCGGDCKPCETCYDGIKNQDETDIDCGGTQCDPCTCSDGKMNQNETGIDCGGICAPCATNACTTTTGFGENGYLSISPASVTAFIDTIPFLDYKAKINIDFPLFSTCRTYEIYLYGNSFISMPVGLTQLFTISNSSDPTPNTCLAHVNMTLENLQVQQGQNIYITRINATTYNIKFCKLIANKTSQYNLSTNFSVNVNFTL